MIVVSILFAYLLGSVSSSYIAGKMTAGVDIREHGSGNAGATNTLRVLGWKLGLVVLIADVVKGILAVAFAHLVTNGSVTAMALSGLFAVIGHNWPVYFSFRGGKGVATTIGVLMTIAWVPSIYAALVALVLLVFTRYVSLASLTYVTLTPLFQLFLHTSAIVIIISFVIAALSFWRHRTNIDRLLHGRENRVFSR